MMKILVFVLILLQCFACNSKGEDKTINGHWYYCDENLGYMEIIITDSALYQMSPEIFGIAPVIIEQISNKEIQVDGIGTIKLVLPNEAVSIFENEKRMMHRLESDVQEFDDYTCDLNLSYFAFRDILHNEFAIRATKSNRFCPSKLPVEIEKNVTTTTLELSEFDYDSLKPRITSSDFDVQILSDTLSEDIAPKLLSTNFSADSSKVLLTIDLVENTLADYMIDAHLDQNEILILKLLKLTESCIKNSAIRLCILLEIKNNARYKSIIFNKQILQ